MVRLAASLGDSGAVQALIRLGMPWNPPILPPIWERYKKCEKRSGRNAKFVKSCKKQAKAREEEPLLSTHNSGIVSESVDFLSCARVRSAELS